ncbi:tetratricopeptide repeat protein [Nocardioides acrostichi]|uniref:Tetratricopeptide repeat protein n=1 Tax=Nocardioides acrostichi TaxID=2784339 RepID=A0A930Y9L5_9ACTN|nr:tetratricopeptide repeat protein [Nocardioides acrostichi]MBF4160493.1 hypothetical protein [Nocardioides acrostichi]
MQRWEVHERARHFIDLARPAGAAELLGPHLVSDPDDTEALVLLAEARADLHQFAEAELAVRAALRTDPTHLQALLQLVDLRRAADDGADAVGVASQAVACHPQAWSAHYALGLAHRTGPPPDPRASLRCANRALELNPHAASAHQLAGLALGDLDDSAQARRAHERTLQLDPGHTAARATLIELDADEGRLGDSAREATALLASSPGDHDLQLLAGSLVVRAGLTTLPWVFAADLVMLALVALGQSVAVRAPVAAALLALVSVVWYRRMRGLPRARGRLMTVVWRALDLRGRLALLVPAGPLAGCALVLGLVPVPGAELRQLLGRVALWWGLGALYSLWRARRAAS